MTSQVLPGDFNDNQVVDAADYVVWQDNLGAADEAALHGNGDGMNGVDQGDYVLWSANFGSTGGGGANGESLAAFAVPEAATAVGLLLALGHWWMARRGRANLTVHGTEY